MCPLVQRQGSFGAQRFAADVAVVSVRAALVHLPSVPGHILLALEGFVADIARKEPLVIVHVALVDFQVAAVGERLLADVAAKRGVHLDPVADLQVLQVALLIIEGTAAFLTSVLCGSSLDFLLGFISLVLIRLEV